MKKSCCWLLGMIFFVGCPSQQVKKTVVAVVKEEPKVQPKKEKKLFPTNMESLLVQKGEFLQAYLQKDVTMGPLAPENKDWKLRYIRDKKTLSWFVQLTPRGKEASLGTFVFIRLTIGLYAEAMGHARPGRFSARLYLRRKGKETLLMETMVIAKGRNFASYPISNREIFEKTLVEAGDVLEFRLVHRSGSNGAVAIGGGLGLQGSQVVIAHTQDQLDTQYRKWNQ